ncbi:MAG: response regulator [Acidimicrobiia bacterium]|nr:response regulator [Acidimicrobiia bacterium]
MSERILVVDDDPDILQFVRLNLELDGFQVDLAGGGKEALERAADSPPDLMLLDVMMPEIDGLTVLRRLRSDPGTSSIPVIVLTARSLAEDRVKGLDLGADDYITKPFDLEELIARVRTVLRRSQQMRDLSPLTGLPGNFRITAKLEECIDRGLEVAVVHADLDNFKAFNDHYGFMRGDSVIKFTAKVLLDAAEKVDDPIGFIGHVGGDDFVAIVSSENMKPFCDEVVVRFDDGVLDHYDTADALQGYIEVTDRRGERHAFPICSLSMGVATSERRKLTSEWEASSVASEMKEVAKRVGGTNYQVDRRT